MFDFKSIQKAVSDLSTGVRSKREEVMSLRAARDALAEAPGTKEDVLCHCRM